MASTIYKANGKTFYSMDEVVEYANDNGFYVSDTDTFTYKGKTVICCNLKSK